MKIPTQNFHNPPPAMPLCDTPYLCTKITFTSFEYHALK